jgi:hypothetical protein
MSIQHGVVVRLSVEVEEPGHFSYAVVHHDQVLDEDADFTSIAKALQGAVGDSEHIIGYEVAYGGYVCGTYTRQQVLADSERIAQDCVSTKAQFQAG